MKVLAKCLVCEKLEERDTGKSLFQLPPNTELKDGMPIVGHTMCNQHQTLYNNGYVAVVETEDDQVNTSSVKVSTANRTGRYAHIHMSALDPDAYKSIIQPNGQPAPLMFVGKETFALVEAMYERLGIDDQQLN